MFDSTPVEWHSHKSKKYCDCKIKSLVNGVCACGRPERKSNGKKSKR